MEEYVDTKQAKKILGCCTKTLQDYDKQDKIDVLRTIGGRRRYNIKKFLKDNNIEVKEEIKKNIIYGRVSSHDRKSDLERQVNKLKEKYEGEYDEVITDIGSGINFKRRGLQKLMDYIIEGKVNKIYITYKDRLCRIGYEMIEYMLIKYSKGKIIISNQESETVTEEITKDLIEIITIYSSKIHGSRNKKKEG